jgi:hypothetical protein
MDACYIVLLVFPLTFEEGLSLNCIPTTCVATLTIASVWESAKATAERLLMGPGMISIATRKVMGAGSSEDVTANCCTHSPTNAVGAGGKLSVRSWMAPLYVKPPDAEVVCLLPRSTRELLASACERANRSGIKMHCPDNGVWHQPSDDDPQHFPAAVCILLRPTLSMHRPPSESEGD